ncbi:transposase [Dapis sp. BLCC M126]|uniref:transposase n=1 Tax=Dapis sp. BLCC M126 TaxID=3400189 RepID=UPI003CE6EBA9
MSRLPEIANPYRKIYPSDLSDSEWNLIKPLLPAPKGLGHPIEVNFREILNGVFYVQRTGCQWEMMPHDLPPYTTVYKYFQKWQRCGLWQQMHDKIRQQLYSELRKEGNSRVAIADSESVTTDKIDRSIVSMVVRKLKRVNAML